MAWNYRVMRHADGSLALHEVYYDDNGRPDGWSETPTTFIGDGDKALKELVGALEMALQDARTRPILDLATGKEEASQ